MGNLRQIWWAGRVLLALGAIAPAATRPAAAQEAAQAPSLLATRVELERLLAGSELTDDERETLQRRLKEGDLQPGDKVLVRVLDEPALSDTFTVRPGRTVVMPNIPEFSVAGLLRSEVEPAFRRQISRYLRDPQVRASALVRMAVLGTVGRPGFYTVPAEALPADLVMQAGGPPQNLSYGKSAIRRGGEKLVSGDSLRVLMTSGRSIDQLNLQGGDELELRQKGNGVLGALTVIGGLSGVILSIYFISQLFK